ncbi:hypothetical protein Hanom_Chr06g00525911 [Helianthus anomalus]
MDGVNKPDENGKISNLLGPYTKKNIPLDKSSKTLGTKITFYSKKNRLHIHNIHTHMNIPS